jgi:hypothetical protein
MSGILAPGRAGESLLNGLEPVETILSRLLQRQQRRIDSNIKDPIDLGFQFKSAGFGQPDDGFWMKIDGLEMPLTEGAVKTAAALIGQKNPAWFNKFDDIQFFPKLFRNYQHKTGFLVRHDGTQVYAVLPDDYRVADAYDLLTDQLLPLMEESVGGIRGVAHVYSGADEGDAESFRIVAGDNIMPLTDEYGQFAMVQLATSDNGLIDTKMWLGLYRAISTTASLRGQTVAKWSHKSEGEPFFSKVGDTVRAIGDYRASYQRIFSELLKEPLPRQTDGSDTPCADLLTLMRKGKLITKQHYDASVQYANGITEDGRQHTTQYDCYNCLTRGAADLVGMDQRHKAEEAALALFTSAGGVVDQLKRAFDKLPDSAKEDED